MIFQRFRGSNGVFQMIALLETCSNQRREHLIESLSFENPSMAALVKTKVLTMEHLSTWTSVELRKLSAELNSDLRSHLFSFLLKSAQSLKLKELGVPPDAKLKVFPSEQHEQMDLLIVLKAREMERIGTLDIRSFDPAKSMHDHFHNRDETPHSKAA